jgi:hypothetical protein
MIKKKSILLLLSDCPGYFTSLFYKMGEVLKAEGYNPVFVSTTPFYEKFKKVQLSQVGKVYYLDEFLKTPLEPADYQDFRIDHWSYFSSFARQTYFFKKHLNNLDAYRKARLFFKKIIEENDAALLVSEGVSNSFLYLAHQQASAANIPFFGIIGSRLPFHYNVNIDVVGNEALVNTDAPAEYAPTNEAPDYMNNSQYGGLFDKDSYFSISFLKELVQFALLKNYSSIETGKTKTFVTKVYKIAYRRIFSDFFFRKILNVYQKTLVFDPGRIYVIYPLHFYPESSTSVWAKYYDGNEYDVIKNAAFSLPENAVLVVKEHKTNMGNNSLNFYKKIKQLPNVVLLDPYYNLKENLEQFDAAITLSGTVGFEALTKNVPVYVLGEIFYQRYPGCHKITSYHELEEKLSVLGKKVAPGDKNETFNRYARISFPGSFNYMSTNCLNDANVRLLLNPLVSYLKNGILKTHHNN